MKKLACSLLTIIILFTISCEIGLGSSVDTDPPSLDIDPAIVSKVIADDFDIEGTYSDDGTISDIKAVLKRTDKTGKDIEIDGILEEDLKKRGSGIWKIPVKSKTDNITDGEYQATVYIKDSMGRITTQSTTFTIDNTPPVLILTKPNSKPTDETVSAYGQRIFLEGSIADTAKETYIKVDFYKDADCTGDPLISIKTDAIAPTDVNSNNARIAVFADPEDELKLYEKIYQSSTKEGSKDVYLKITASDIAGNETTDFYFSKDLAKNITKTKNKAADAYGLAPIDIYNILNGTDALKSSGRAAEDSDTANIKRLLNESKNQTAMISVNPENSPYFTVSGMKILTKSGKDFESKENGYYVINGAQSLEISVFMGSDSIELVDDDSDTAPEDREFYVYALECDEYGDPLEEDKEENRIKLYSKSKETGSGVNKKTYYSIGGKQGHKTTSGAYVFTVPMNKTVIFNPDIYNAKDPSPQGIVTQNLEIGKNYIIRVSGKDNEGNPIEPSEALGYGFHLSSGGGAPVLNITEPQDNTVFYKKGQGVTFTGSTKSDEGVPEVTVWNGEQKIGDVSLDTEIDGELNEFSYTIPKEIFDQNNSKIYSISIKASRDDAITDNKYSIWYDVEGPNITINSIQPVVIANEKTNNINGNLKINGTIIDTFDQVGETTFKVFQDGIEVPAVGKTIDDSFDLALDTTRLADKKSAILKIQTQDRVGNISIWEREYYVDQSTDKPSLISSEGSKNIDKGIGSEGLDFVEAGNNLFIRGGNLVLSVSDDDGVASARVTVQAYDKVTKTISLAEEKQDILYDNSPAVISHTLPSEVGLYLTTVSVYDNEFKSISETPNNYITKQFFLRVTGNGPDVYITPNHEYIKTGSTYILTFNITDEGNKPYKFKVNNVDERDSINEDSFTYIYQPAATEKSVKFTILDKNNGFTDKVFQPKFDDILPEISITSNPDYAATGENSFLYKGTLSDLPSGVENVKIKFDDITNSQTTDWVNVESFSKSSWNYEVIWSGSEASATFREVFAAENEKKVTVKAIDGAGNEKEATSTFIYDKKAPEVTLGAPSATDGKDNVSLSLTINDSNPEKIIVTVTDSQGNVKDTINVTSFTGSTDFKIASATILKEKLTADGDYTITAKGIDKNGRESPVKSAIIKRDTSAPTVVIKTPVDDLKINEKALTETTQFSIRLDDANGTGVTKVFYKFTHDAVPGSLKGTAGGYTEDTGSNGPYTIDIPFIRADASAEDKAGKLVEGHWYLHIYAVDEANNESAPVTRRFDIDLTYPSLDVTIQESATTKLKTDGFYYFNAALTGSITASDTSGAVTTTYSIDGASPVTLAAGSTWTLPASSFTDNAKHTLTFETKDGFNKVTKKSFELYKDIAAPVIAVNPQGPVNSAPTLSGTVNDGTGVGATKILWSKTGETASDFAELTYTAGTSNWTYPVVFAVNEEENTKTYWFKAQDALGNTTSTPVSVSFEYDKAPPSITFNDINEYQTTNNFTISGTASDSNGLKTIHILKNDESFEVINIENNAKNYTWSKALTIEDGKYTFTVYAEDVAGKKSSILSKNISVDSHAPETLIISAMPTPEETMATQITLRGTASDASSGTGLRRVEITITDANDSTKSFTTNATGTNDWFYILNVESEAAGSNWKPVFATEGPKKINLKAYDMAGNVKNQFTIGAETTTKSEVNFVYDKAVPELIINNADSKYISGGSTITGTVSDTYQLDSVKVSLNDQSATTVTQFIKSQDGKTGTWSHTIPTTEGTYKYKFVVEDSVGHQTYSKEITKIVDSHAPNISSVSIGGRTEYSADNWYNSQTMNVEVMASDEGDSGMNMVEYSTDPATAATRSWIALTESTETSGKYVGPVGFTNAGRGNVLFIRATDKAGNVKYYDGTTTNGTTTEKSLTINIDATTPNLKSLFYKVGEGSVQPSGGTVYIAANKKLIIYGIYSDNESGATGLEFNSEVTGNVSTKYYKAVENITTLTKDNLTSVFINANETTTPADINYWMAEFTPSIEAGETKELIITGKNEALGQTKLEPAFSITKDTEEPEVVRENTSFRTSSTTNVVYEKNGKYYVNNLNQTFTLKGIATDNIALEKVELKAKNKDGTEVIVPSIKGGSPATWEFSNIDLSSLDTKASLYVVLTDRAGNTNAEENQKIDIVFDTAAPVGKHLEDGSGKDIYFRVGNFPNDDNSTSDSGTAKWVEATDNDVGGKYSAITYNNSTQMNIRGLYDDGDILGTADVSGVKAIYYKVYNGNEYEEIADKLANLKDNANADTINTSLVTLVKENGTQIKPIDNAKLEQRRVFYTDTDSSNATAGSSTLNGKLTSEGYLGTNANGKVINKHWATIKSNFDQRLTGFIEGTNYLVMVTEDNVGNTAVDKAILANGDIYNNFRLNVDVTAPAVTCSQSENTQLYSNTANDATGKLQDGNVVLSGTISDGTLSGVSSITIKVGSKQTVLEIDDKDEEEKLVITKDNVKADPVAMSQTIEDSDTDKLTIANDSNVRNWKVTLPGSYFTGLTGTQRIKAITKDKAKNDSEEIEIATVIVDADNPVITLKKPDNIVGTNTVNGKITLSGTINDANLTEESGDTKTLELYYTTKTGADTDTTYTIDTDASNAWRMYDAQNHAASWAFADIDTSRLVLKVEGGNTSYISDQTTVYFVVRATDKAGNIGYSNKLSLVVDQDTDRPELTFRNLTLANNTSAMSSTTKILAKTRELWGTIKDDDGIVYVKVSENGTDWSGDCYENGTWTYPASKDGVVDLWFQIKDTEGGIFTSKENLTSLDVTTPKLVDANSNKYGYRSGSGVTAGNANVLDSKVYLRVDTIRPKIEKTKIYYTTDSTVAATITSANIADQFGDTIPAGWSKLSDLGSSYLGGTVKGNLWLLYAATDDNGILEKEETFKKGDETITSTDITGITFTSTTDNTICPRIVKFDLSGKPTGTYNLSLKVKDQAGSWCDPEEFQIQIDNTPPIVTYTTFDIDGKDAYGSLAVEFKGTTRDPEAQQISNLYFAVSKDTTVPSSFTDMTAYLTETGRTSWYINFECNSATEVASHNNSNNPTNNYHTEKLNKYLDSLYEGTPSNETAEKDLYIWVKAKDALGNESIPAPRKINVIPQADKPAVKFIFPKETATSANTILGGTITITGETSIQSDEVEKVYLQIDPDYNGSAFNESTWEQDLNTLIGTQEVGYEVTGIDVKTSPAATTTTEMRGILVDGTTSWNISINTLGEFKSKGEGDNKVNRKVAIRAYAVSKTNKLLSEPKFVSFEVDPNRPSFSGFGDSNDIILEKSDVSTSKKYKENDWVSGVWYLKGSVQHAAGIKTLTLKYDTEETGITLIANGSVKEENLTGNLAGTGITSRTDGKGWDFKIPVSKATGSAKTDFTLTATDARPTGAQDSSRTFIVQYDNNAPVNFTARTTNGDLADNTVAKFTQSNQTFELSGSIKDGDGESGLERIAFYFTREIGSDTYFIDPMLAKTKSSGTAPDLYRNNYRSLSGITNEDGLYWVEVTGASYSNEKLTATIPADYTANIRTGGICKIDNIVYRIEGISGNQITLSGVPVNTSDLTVKFALAQIIDNTYTESLKNQSSYTGIYDSTKNDRNDLMSYGDGDQMREGIEASGMSYSWQAAINSLNIYDGPVTVHFVYYDKAGNSDSKTFNAQFCNNAPRIASVTVGSDYNGNEIVGDIASELATYYVNQKEVNGAYKAGSLTSETLEIGTNTTAFKKLKGKSQIDVEVVGGNGDLYYSYNIGQDKGASTNTVKGNGLKIGVGHQDNSIISEYTVNTGLPNQYIKDDEAWVTERTNTIDLPVSYFEKYLGKDGQAIANNDETHPVTWFQYTIWDQTDGLEKFSTEKPSQNVTVQIALNVQVNDTVDPQVVIDRFYWKGKSDNSLYNNDPAQGHIELENDWIESDFYKGLTEAPTSGEFDADPKVSGKITFRGSAWDNTRIDELWAKISYTNASSTTVFHSLANSYDATTNQNLDDYKKIAVYEKKGNGTDKDDMVWKVASAAIGDGWTFSIDTETVDNVTKYKGKIDDDGHIVYWTMNFDTKTLPGVCANDVTVDIRAVDSKDRITSGTPVSGTDSTGKKAPAEYSNMPSYRMDVVPYITKISTTNYSKSGLKDINIRSASGKYSIIKGTTSDFITVEGFNLNVSDARIVKKDRLAALTTAFTANDITLSPTNKAADYSSFKGRNNLSNSGYLEVLVNGVRSLNNINGNNSYGTTKNSDGEQLTKDNATIKDYENAYNREPDYYSTKNVQLTDDRYLLIFDMHTAQTPDKTASTWKDLKNAYYPVMIMNGDNPVFGYTNGSGGPDHSVGTARGTGAGSYRSSHAMPQRAEFNGTSGDEVYTEYLIKASAWDAMGMAVDEGGRYYNVSCYNRDGSAMSLIYDRYGELYTNGNGWGAGTGYSNYSGNWSYASKNNAITLDSMNYGGEILLGRYMYPKLIANGNSKTGDANVYMAYYDDGTGEIAFRNFRIGTTTTSYQLAGNTLKDSKNTGYGQYVNFKEASSSEEAADYYGTGVAEGRLQAVAKGSRYYDMAVTSENHVVILYYDEDNSRLKLIYSTDAVDGSSPTTAVAWTPSSVIFPDYVGTYCSMTLDSNNGIHIAAFDAGNADLKYFYLPSYSSTTLTNLTIDATGSVGHWTGIAICNDADNPEINGKPVISYYNSTETGSRESIKLAYPKAAIGSIGAGVDSDGYTTGNWEYMTVPAITPPQGGDTKFQKVCLGFDTKGIPVLGYSAANLEFGKQLSEAD